MGFLKTTTLATYTMQFVLNSQRLARSVECIAEVQSLRGRSEQRVPTRASRVTARHPNKAPRRTFLIDDFQKGIPLGNRWDRVL